MTTPFPEPPFRREFSLAKWLPGAASSAKRAWERSAAAIETIQASVAALDDPRLVAVAVSGSLGRMEGREDSDWDLIFVVRDDTEIGSAEELRDESSKEYGRSLWRRLDPVGPLRPEAEGIFATPISFKELADPAYRGSLNDSPARFGKRIQSLLDAQPIWGDPHAGRRAALRFYGIEGLTADGPDQASGDGREGTHLFNDLIRYHRSLCAMTMWLSNPESDKTLRLKLKLRFSRFLNYLGLLLPLAQGIDRGEVAPTLAPFWNLTPLERVLEFANEENDAAVEAFCRSYEAFLAFLEKPAPSADDWSAIDVQADRFRESACEILRSQPFLQRGRAADLMLL